MKTYKKCFTSYRRAYLYGSFLLNSLLFSCRKHCAMFSTRLEAIKKEKKNTNKNKNKSNKQNNVIKTN